MGHSIFLYLYSPSPPHGGQIPKVYFIVASISEVFIQGILQGILLALLKKKFLTALAHASGCLP